MKSTFQPFDQTNDASLDEELDFLYQRINYERKTDANYPKHFRLDSMRELLAALGNPQERYEIVHVAGTKGKGSVSRLVASTLNRSGIRTGVYSSPHLETIRERIVVGEEMISPRDLANQLRAVRQATCELDNSARETTGREYSFFEILTAVGLKYFADQRVEKVVLEVGLGGRLDSTNVCQPRLCVITNISIDHTRQLGSTVDRIAREKAGIIKQNIPVISGATDILAAREIRETCSVMNAPLWELGRDFDYEIESVISQTLCQSVRVCGSIEGNQFDVRQIEINSIGVHQAVNAAVAMAAIQIMRPQEQRISIDAFRAAARSFSMIGRFEVLCSHPFVVVDMAHNVSSIDALTKALHLLPAIGGKRWLLFASSQDKDVTGMLRLLTPSFDEIVLTKFVENPRAMEPAEMALQIDDDLAVSVFETPDHAWSYVQSQMGNQDLVCVTGSAFLVAETRRVILEWCARASHAPRT